jgi:hypothetical protein
MDRKAFFYSKHSQSTKGGIIADDEGARQSKLEVKCAFRDKEASYPAVGCRAKREEGGFGG